MAIKLTSRRRLSSGDVVREFSLDSTVDRRRQVERIFLRVVFGLVNLIDSHSDLDFSPHFRSGLIAVLSQAGDMEPSLISKECLPLLERLAVEIDGIKNASVRVQFSDAVSAAIRVVGQLGQLK